MAVFDDTPGLTLLKSFSFIFPALRSASFARARLWRRICSLPDIPSFLRCCYQRFASLSARTSPRPSWNSTRAGVGIPIFPSVGLHGSAWITVPIWLCALAYSRRWKAM